MCCPLEKFEPCKPATCRRCGTAVRQQQRSRTEGQANSRKLARAQPRRQRHRLLCQGPGLILQRRHAPNHRPENIPAIAGIVAVRQQCGLTLGSSTLRAQFGRLTLRRRKPPRTMPVRQPLSPFSAATPPAKAVVRLRHHRGNLAAKHHASAAIWQKAYDARTADLMMPKKSVTVGRGPSDTGNPKPVRRRLALAGAKSPASKS